MCRLTSQPIQKRSAPNIISEIITYLHNSQPLPVYQSAAKAMEIRARYDFMQAKGAWEKMESEMKADHEIARKTKDTQLEALNK